MTVKNSVCVLFLASPEIEIALGRLVASLFIYIGSVLAGCGLISVSRTIGALILYCVLCLDSHTLTHMHTHSLSSHRADLFVMTWLLKS